MQRLRLLKLQLGFVEKGLPEGPCSFREECEQIQKNIDQIIENVRRLSRDLRPAILEDLGLAAALRRLVQNFSKRHPVKAAVRLQDLYHLTSPQAQAKMYRIYQEALNNIVKHAQASEISIAVKRKGDRLHCVVRDNGRGFPRPKGKENSPSKASVLIGLSLRMTLFSSGRA